jgi:hypothetical protein
MEYFVILTCSIAVDGKTRQVTIADTVTADDRTTRGAMLGWAISQLPSEFGSQPNIVFFSAKPNLITI